MLRAMPRPCQDYVRSHAFPTIGRTLRNSIHLSCLRIPPSAEWEIAATARSGAAYVRGSLRELWVRPRRNIAALDALRAIAVLLVLCAHWAIPEFEQAGGRVDEVGAIIHFPAFYYGWAGVDLFFVLSGFLIGSQLWRDVAKSGTVDYTTFFLRRTYRIWPLYFAMLAYYGLVSDRIRPRLVDWLFLSNYWPGGVSRGWSLSTEEQFYLAVPVMLIILGRRVRFGRWPWVLLAIECSVLAVRGWTIAHLPPDVASTDFTLVYPFHTHLEGLIAGLLLAWAGVRWPSLYQPRVGSGPAWRVLAAAGALALVAGALHTVPGKLFSWLVWGLAFGAATAIALIDHSWLTGWMRWRVWYPLSRLSYGMYLNHFWVLPWTSVIAVQWLRAITSNEAVTFLGSLVFGTTLSVAFAVVTFLLVERPFLLLRDRHLARRSTAHALLSVS